jgi:50S ribosomal protein L16 3-hydroxylase
LELGIDLAAFLAEFWQKKPLLIKAALPGFSDFLSPEELAGLACEEGVESRLVFNDASGWRLKPGPFTERDFTFLPETNWTLLVQSVDHWLPEVKTLLQEVSFIPAWRLDDVMVSYASRHGGVGPHFDYYDVFLVQGAGSRQWQIGAACDSTTPLNTESGLKILEEFTAEQTIELETGDILYIPAGISHWGTAIEAGLSYSIGFRAPDLAELLTAFSIEVSLADKPDVRFRDPALATTLRAGEISKEALQQVRALLEHALADDELLLNSFGNLMTEPRLPELLEEPESAITPEQLAVFLQKGMTLSRHPATRLACHHQGDSTTLFVNGEAIVLSPLNDKLLALNEELQSAFGRPLDLKAFQRNEGCLNLLAQLFNQGALIQS